MVSMLEYLIGGLVLVWLSVITYFVFRTRVHYHRLTERTNTRKIDDVLDSLLYSDDVFKHDIEELKKDLAQTRKSAKAHFQKVGLIRFNPFGRTGGDQSFVLALLDEEENGVTMNFIYTPDGIRVYTKRVKSGKGDGHELSEEEAKAIKQAG